MKQKQRIALLGIMAVALILAACGGDSGNNSSESEEDSSSSIEFSSSSEQINSSSVVKSSSSSVGISSSSVVVSSSSVKVQSSSSVPLSSSVVKSSSSSVGVSSSSVVVSSSSVKLQSSSSTPLSSSVGESSSSSSIEYGTLSYEGQTYKTVVIGTQTWMAENLNYAVDSSWCYDNEPDSCAKYGRLYQWASAMDLDTVYNSSTWGGSDVNHQGICPDDWHLPSTNEWNTLYDYVNANNGSDGVGTSLKSVSGWKASSGIATGTNQFGFSALPAGRRNVGNFYNAGNYAYFWSATENYSSNAYYWYLYYSNEDFGNYFSSGDSKNYGFSVRCLKD
jgi:uncharacterized protein (TIGR02145 family)